jgi:hypothetical protein
MTEPIEAVCKHGQVKGRKRYCTHPLVVADGRFLVRHCKADEDCPAIKYHPHSPQLTTGGAE